MKGRQISSIQFVDGGTLIEFIDPDAVRGNGLGLFSTLHIPADEPVFTQEVDDLRDAAIDLLELGLEELQRTRRGDDE